jgi:hypothetical protein
MYVYLARRDKKGINFLGSFAYPSKIYPTKVSESDLTRLNMDQRTSLEIIEALRENRMEYELVLETAESFELLRSSLTKRGYSKIPSTQFSTSLKSGLINEKMLVTKDSVMTRRGSAIR